MRKKINIEGVNSLVKNAEIDYFHYEEDICKEILSSKQIFAEDKAFLAQFPKVTKELLALQFCPTSPFFSGCIRISAK